MVSAARVGVTLTLLIVAGVIYESELQALVYNIRLPTTAIVVYAIGLEKLSANEQFF